MQDSPTPDDERDLDDELSQPSTLAPFVDVMMVLLVVFIAITPMMTEGIDITLPEVGGHTEVTALDQLMVSLSADGTVWLDEVVVPRGQLPDVLAAAAQGQANGAIIRADAETAYEVVADTLSLLQAVGFTEIGFLVDGDRDG